MEFRPVVHSLAASNNITALDSSPSSPALLVGDCQGHVHIYETSHTLSHLTSFLSHCDFVDRETNRAESRALAAVRFLYSESGMITLLAANEKTVKLWKVDVSEGKNPVCRKAFGNAHKCRIHSVSVSPSQQHFISADDLRINIWDVNHSSEAYCLADLTPTQIATLREVLLHASFSHHEASLVLFTSTAGIVRIGDLRVRSSLLPPVIELKDGRDRGRWYSEFVGSITGADFSETGSFIYARDLMQVRVWDVRNPSLCASLVPIIDSVPSQLTDLDGRFQVKSHGLSSFVTGGLGSEVIISTKSGEKTRTDLRLGAHNLPTVTCNPHGSQIFAAAGNKVAFVQSDRGTTFPI